MIVVSCFEIGLSQAVQHGKDRGLFLKAYVFLSITTSWSLLFRNKNESYTWPFLDHSRL